MNWRTCVVLVQLCLCFSVSSQLYEDDDCKLEGNVQGRCVRLSQCPSAVEQIQKREHPVTCGYIGFIPIICCPLAQTTTTRFSDQKCLFYQSVQLKPTEEPPTAPTVLTKQNIEKPKNIPRIPPPPLPTPFALNSEKPPNLTNDIDYLDTLNPVKPGENDINDVNVPNTNEKTLNTPVRGKLTLENQANSDNTNVNVPTLTNVPSADLVSPEPTDDSELTTENLDIGSKAKNEEFPHMAALGILRGNSQLWTCGGSLVSEKFVLTAAQCLSSIHGSVDWVTLGSTLINHHQTHPHFPQQIHKITRRIPHPSFKSPSSYHDIALVELDRPVEFTTSLRPACLHTVHEHDVDLQVQLVATGWRLTENSSDVGEALEKVDLEVYTVEECAKAYEDVVGSGRLRNGVVGDGQFCAGVRGGQDTCISDTGGPIQVKLNDSNGAIYSIIGIKSFGRPCGLQGAPGVYIRVARYVPWLETIIWPNEY